MDVTIRVNGQAVSVEVSVEVFKCLDQSKRKMENLHLEKRRHWDICEFDEYIVLTEGRNCYYQTPEQIYCRKETLEEIMWALSLCIETQRQRFLLYALDGLSYSELGKLCGCFKYAARDSVEAVRKKYRKIYNISPHD